jgi:hypothetical protein
MDWFKKMLYLAAFLGNTTALAEPQDNTQVLNTYLHQKWIMKSYEAKDISVKAKTLLKPSSYCYEAVEVLDIRSKGKTVTFRLAEIGSIGIGGKSGCHGSWGEKTFAITDIGNITPESLASDLREVFLTPEAYLAIIGPPPNIEQSMGAPNKNPEVILEILPRMTAEASRDSLMNGHKKQMVAIRGTVRTDGKIDSPSVVRDPGFGLGERALSVLTLWRFQPARKGDKAIDAPLVLEFSFSSY